MRTGILLLLSMLLTAGAVNADPGSTRTFYVRYAINMDFLPPLIGERLCRVGKPCTLVSLDQITVILTAPRRGFYGTEGEVSIDCRWRACAFRGRPTQIIEMQKRRAGLVVTDRIDPIGKLELVLRRSNQIGEILLAY